jgi:hypothetical protein
MLLTELIKHKEIAPIKIKHNMFETDSVLIFRQMSKGKTSSLGARYAKPKPLLSEEGD